MDLSLPLHGVAPTLDAEVLTVLSGTTAPLTGRRVSQLAARGSRPGIQRVLNRLVAEGLVLAQDAGASVLYQLNRDHLLASAVLEVVAARDELIRRLQEAVDQWARPCVNASLFGSVARGGDADQHSDVDLLVVRPAAVAGDDEIWQRQLRDLEDAVLRWTGNSLSWFETTEDDLRRAVAAEEPVVDSWRTESIHLSGVRLSQLLRSMAA